MGVRHTIVSEQTDCRWAGTKQRPLVSYCKSNSDFKTITVFRVPEMLLGRDGAVTGLVLGQARAPAVPSARNTPGASFPAHPGTQGRGGRACVSPGKMPHLFHPAMNFLPGPLRRRVKGLKRLRCSRESACALCTSREQSKDRGWKSVMVRFQMDRGKSFTKRCLKFGRRHRTAPLLDMSKQRQEGARDSMGQQFGSSDTEPLCRRGSRHTPPQTSLSGQTKRHQDPNTPWTPTSHT